MIFNVVSLKNYILSYLIHHYCLGIAQELFPSSNLNICIRQPDGSYTGDSLDSPKGNLDENLEKSSQVSGSGGADSWP